MATAAGIRAGRAFVELAADGSKLAADLRAAEAKVKAFGQGLATVGSRFAKAGAAVGLPLAAATLTFGGFEKQMARVKALTGSTPDEFRALSNEAKRLGETTEFSASQAAAMMGEFALRGFKANEILKAASPALQMATAGQLELAEAAGIAGDIMGGMRLKASQLGEVTDTLAYAFTNSATDLRQLGEAFKYVGPSAAAMGFTIDEVGAALMVLADGGQKADMAGTTLRGMLETLKDPSKEARQELARLGVVLDDGTGKFRDLSDIIGDMERGLSKLSEVEAAQSISRIFTNRQTTGTAVLTGKDAFGVSAQERLKRKQRELLESGGTGARIQATQLDTLWGAWKMIESAVEGVAIVVGEALNPVLRDLSDAVIAVTGLVGGWAKGNGDLFRGLLKGVVIAGLVGGSLLAVGVAVQVASLGFAGLATLVGGLAAAVGLLGSAFALLAGPVGLAAAGVAAFLVYTKAGRGVVAGMREGVAGLGRTFASIGDTFNQTWKGVVDAVKGGELALAGEVAWKGLTVAWQKGVNYLRTLWVGFTSYFVEAFHKAVFGVATWINDAWSGVEKVWFESFSLIARAWGVLMDFMRKAMVNFTVGFRTQWAAIRKILDPGGVDYLKEFEAIVSDGVAQKKKIDEEREAADAKNESDRQDIENRRLAVRHDLLLRQQAEARARRDARRDADDAAAANLSRLEGELAAAVDAARQAALPNAKKAALGAAAGGLAVLDLSGGGRKLPTREGVTDAVRQAAGAGGGDAAGTFDAAMIRFLAGTGNDSMAREQARKQQEQLDVLKKVLDVLTRGAAGAVFN